MTYVAIGASFLWPWNCLLIAGMFIQPYLKDNPTLQRSYSSCVMLASTCTNITVSTLLAMNPHGFGRRIRFGEVLIAIGFLVMSLLTLLRIPPIYYFFCFILLVMFISTGTTHIQNGVTAITQRIPGGREARAVLIGQAISGIVPPIFSMILASKHDVIGAFTASLKSAIETTLSTPGVAPTIPPKASTASVLFLTSSALCMYALWSFRGPVVETQIRMSQEEDGEPPSLKALVGVLEELRSPATAIFLGFTASLGFSVFANTITSSRIPTELFCPMTYFLWNVGDLIGRSICESDRFQIRDSKKLVLYAYARLAFIPFLVFYCWLDNPSDLIYLGVMFVYGFTNGHAISSAISYAPFCVPEEQRPAAGGLIGMVIAFGLVAGALVSFLIIPFVHAK